MIHYIVIFIYLSFGWDFFICPIASEASTKALMEDKPAFTKAALSAVFVISLCFYVLPLVLSIFQLINGAAENRSIYFLAIAVAFWGRYMSVRSSYLLSKNLKEVFKASFFKYSRNPISLGTYFTFLGLCLIHNTWYLWLGLVFYILNIHFKIRIEEKYLLNKYGSSYEAYLKSTPRYLFL